MPHISVVGRKSWRVRFAILSLYLILSVGAVTMVVPFMLMVSTSFTSNVDAQEFRIYPKFWFDDSWLYRKFIESEYNEDILLYSRVAGEDHGDFRELSLPEKSSEKQAKEYDEFKLSLPLKYTLTAHAYSVSRGKISLEGVFLYRQFLEKRFGGDIEKANQEYGEARDYFDMQVPRELWWMRDFEPAKTTKYADQWEFKKSLEPRFLIPVPLEAMYREYVKAMHDSDLPAVAQAYGKPIESLTDIEVHRTLPVSPAEAADWEEYVRREAPFQFMIISPEAETDFQRFLSRKYHGDLSLFNRNYFGEDTARYYISWTRVPLPETPPPESFPRADYSDFIQQSVPMKYVQMQTPLTLYQDFLRDRYETINGVNGAYGTTYASFAAIELPTKATDAYQLATNKQQIRRQFTWRNYRDVTDYIILHGRSVFNTIVLVACTILITLTINPIAAYALSRFKLPQTYKILLFCLATMAFPAEVSAIQNFLLLKQFHLLNTYWALFLPGAANGFSIFLLKGFFDSLPQELYEAAELDGAGEFQMYRRICYAMSKPVLAVIALGAFTGAYGSFMWALIVCQNPKMWTLMVWLQQMSGWAPMSMVYASLVLAAIPTLLVFIFCQNIIMRGIILPMEK
ncbi:MAG: ABC transporter permease subunit [Armatimonadetes bacterium]|nr:ABC transporter permease subunit [Armatimonadota bacterium]PIU61084.1 MAG: hypothetical protein COS85_21920 [Armatimonadetes bacterium CG07_land_8_20_14_0_80_59_28]PIX41737.1 MAG: hypothetical protein COZ56_11150 [Armatimonadetes bacterium CG_4_8_14_3_um_filter_58_9]PIY43226.1 MAG: hypothetical protein COZ05_11720 [Armatimonadetes bacterium CG_4_10_14_3_um_filter_59_10]PJB62469.1 MAG: hypothetical protein CO095_18455 [Armatimonadetes bacterium CG_4_9_14_3_um_filter_58_7]